MGFIRIDCNGYNELQEHIEKLAKEYAGYRVYALFTGSILPETKQNWCPDCVVGIILFFYTFIFLTLAEPVIWETLTRISEEPFNIAFIKCRVGFRDSYVFKVLFLYLFKHLDGKI